MILNIYSFVSPEMSITALGMAFVFDRMFAHVQQNLQEMTAVHVFHFIGENSVDLARTVNTGHVICKTVMLSVKVLRYIIVLLKLSKHMSFKLCFLTNQTALLSSRLPCCKVT